MKFERYKGKPVNFMHVVIIKSINPLTIVMGNLPADVLVQPKHNWPRLKPKDENYMKWNILSGKNNVRWNMLNFETTETQKETGNQD